VRGIHSQVTWYYRQQSWEWESDSLPPAACCMATAAEPKSVSCGMETSANFTEQHKQELQP